MYLKLVEQTLSSGTVPTSRMLLVQVDIGTNRSHPIPSLFTVICVVSILGGSRHSMDYALNDRGHSTLYVLVFLIQSDCVSLL